MNKFLTVAVVAFLAITANQSQAVELVKAQPISVNTLTEDAKASLINAIELNKITLNAIQKTARTQVAMNTIELPKVSKVNVKTVILAE